MQEIPARAALVSAPDVGKGLTTFVSREEVEKAIQREDGPLELILDVTRFSNGDPAETRSVAVAWERTDLEQLLRQAEGERVALTFDGEALREAIESDVEAHGMREKVLVLTVAATAAAGITAGAAAGQSYGPDDRGLARGTAITQPSLGADDRALPRMDPTSQPSLGADDRALPRTDPVSQPSLGPDDRALPRTDPVSQPSLGPDDRALPRTDPLAQPEPVTGTSDDGTFVELPSPGTIAVIGGIALAITGAAFAAGAAARRRVHPA
jgi:hypothetical protein